MPSNARLHGRQQHFLLYIVIILKIFLRIRLDNLPEPRLLPTHGVNQNAFPFDNFEVRSRLFVLTVHGQLQIP